MAEKVYPMLEINLDKMYNNVSEVISLCQQKNISITGVIKGVNALAPIVDSFIDAGCISIASSRLDQLKEIKKTTNVETMLIRIPMLSEVKRMIKYASVSLNSERVVLDMIEQECKRQGVKHRVILMMDLGDLREGYFSEEELIETALYVENELENVYLEGIGTNLGCYGSIKPDIYNLDKLGQIATEIENKIGRKLDKISGGATSSLSLILEEKMPDKINHLRIGEGILLNYDLPNVWGYNIKFLSGDALILKAEVIEVKNKPSYPIGEIFVDAFGNKPEYKDEGIRKRALLAIGKQDIGDFDNIFPINKNIRIIGCSSDHLIADVTSIKDVKVGDVFEFKINYPAMLYLTGSETVNKQYIKKAK